ncbi:hypothetical protein IIA79_02210 [bacterium]|nr:hypothetical protein [bacterium]
MRHPSQTRPTRHKPILLALGLLFLACIAACNGKGGATGGIRFDPLLGGLTTLVTADGKITAVIPEGAFTEKVELTFANVTERDMAVPGPEGRSLLMAVEFSAKVEKQAEPDDGGEDGEEEAPAVATPASEVILAAPVEITFELDAQLPGGFSLPIYKLNQNSGRYEAAEVSGAVSEDGTELTFSLEEFGSFAIFSLLPSEIPPPAPTGLALLAASTQVRKLAWEEVTMGGAVGYNLYRSPEGQDSFSKVNTDVLSATLYSDQLTQEGGYLYRVTSVNDSGMESEPSAEVQSPAVDFDIAFTFGENELDSPISLAVDETGRLIYIADAGKQQVKVFSLDGAFISSIAKYGVKPARQPSSVDFDADGNLLYIVEQGFWSVFILDADNDYSLVGTFGTEGEAPREFLAPSAVLALAGQVLVADSALSTIQSFTPLGVYLDTIALPGAGEGQLDGPASLAHGGSGSVLIADTNNGRVQVFSQELVFESSVELAVEDGGPLEQPLGIASDFRGRLYVSDTGNRRVVVFDSSGALLFHFGSEGGLMVEFHEDGPAGLAIDSTTGYLYVCDPGNQRIAVFKS